MKKTLTIMVLVVMLSVTTIGLANASPGLQGSGTVHYVTFGETLYSIAMQYGVSANAILQINGLANPDLIYVGQPLVIPGVLGGPGGYAPEPKAYGCANFHIVSAGETLSGIAYSYGVSLQELLNHNYLYNSNVVYVGQQICLPPRAQKGYIPQPASYHQGYSMPANTYYHTVRNGETLHWIAQQYGVNYLDIVNSNNMTNAGLIWAGQRLYIPNYHPAPPPVAAPVQGYSHKPDYAPPAAPPPAPVYGGGGGSDKDYEPTSADAPIPPAPEYQESPPLPLLPVADHPIEVVVNGGQSWVGKLFNEPYDDPDGVTTLIVNTGEKDQNRVVRMRSGDYEVKGELGLVPEFGIDRFRFAFKYIPPGDYDVWIDDPEIQSEKVQVRVDPGKRVEVGFRKGVAFSGPTFASPDGWVLASWDNPSEPGKNLGAWSNILIQTPASGLWVKIESEGGGYKASCFTGTKGPGACDFAGLSAGLYWIWIDGTDLTLKTYMDGNAYATFAFARQPVAGEENKIGPVTYD